jgi:hypothetical protein
MFTKFEEVHLLFLELLTEHQMMDGLTQRCERKSWAKERTRGNMSAVREGCLQHKLQYNNHITEQLHYENRQCEIMMMTVMTEVKETLSQYITISNLIKNM